MFMFLIYLVPIIFDCSLPFFILERETELDVGFKSNFDSPVQNVRKVEVVDIVANDEIRVVTRH